MVVVAGVAVAVVGVGIVVVPAVVIHLYESEFAPAFWIKMDKAYVSI